MAAWAIPLLTTGISALSGLFGNKNKQQQTSEGSINRSTSSTGTTNISDIGRQMTTSGPQLSPAYQGFINQLLSSYGNLAQPVNLRPYAASQMQGINKASGLSSRALDSIMAARGLSRSPVAGAAAANLDANRVSQIVGINQQIPLLQRQLTQSGLESARGMASLLPSFSPTTSVVDTSGTRTGTTTGFENMFGTSSETSTGTGTQGGGLGGLFNVLGLLANSKDSSLQKLLAGLFSGGQG